MRFSPILALLALSCGPKTPTAADAITDDVVE
ncbi:MAG: hypothetical protein ACI855_000482, partial [Myxococcota bacterium]